MSATHPSAVPGGDLRRRYPLSLQQSAAALWGDGFWGREPPDPEAARSRPAPVRAFRR